MSSDKWADWADWARSIGVAVISAVTAWFLAKVHERKLTWRARKERDLERRIALYRDGLGQMRDLEAAANLGASDPASMPRVRAVREWWDKNCAGYPDEEALSKMDIAIKFVGVSVGQPSFQKDDLWTRLAEAKDGLEARLKELEAELDEP